MNKKEETFFMIFIIIIIYILLFVKKKYTYMRMKTQIYTYNNSKILEILNFIKY